MIDYFLNKFDRVDGKIVIDDVVIDSPIIDYITSDKSLYRTATECGFDDKDNDLLVDNNDHFLMNWNFVFINTHVFSEAATHYRNYKCYTFYEEDSFEYNAFWREETKRRKHGMTANCKLLFDDIPEYFDVNTTEERKKELLKPLRITGDYYNFLNYSRIKRGRTPEEKEIANKQGRKSKGKIEDFPIFIDGQYWDHKIDEFCINNGFNIIESKARRKGFSYSKAAHSANTINLYKNTSIIHIAYDITFLTGLNALTYMAKRNLDWYERNTYWKRGYLKESLDAIELGFKQSKTGHIKYGHQSTIISEGAKGNESAAVGKDANEIDYEEAGKWPNLNETVSVTNSAAEDGDNNVGIQRMFGTGGTKDANWYAFSNFFYNPVTFGAIEMANVWDKNKLSEPCGFFYPQIWAYFPYIDEHGNSDMFRAYARDYKKKKAQETSLSAILYSVYVGQRANMPSEAFLNTTENIFTHRALTNKINYLRNDPSARFYRDGWVDYNENQVPEFKSNLELNKAGLKSKLYLDDYRFDPKYDITGADRIYQMPYRMDDGTIPPKCYIVTYDPYGANKEKNEVTTKHSLASINVWGLTNPHFPHHANKLVHSYTGRLNTMEKMDLKALAITEMWGATLVTELDKGTLLGTAKKYKKLKWLEYDISYYYEPNAVNRSTRGILIGSGEKKLKMLNDLCDFLYEPISMSEDGIATYNIDNVNDLPFLLELDNFRLGGNYDRISSNMLAIPYLKYYTIKYFVAKTKANTQNTTKKVRLGDLFK